MSVFNPVSVIRRETSRQTVPARHSHEPVLITEQQVLFSTAAAAGSRGHRDVVAMVSHAAASVAEHWHARAERRRATYYPPRCTYLERGLMAREMERL
ncbi:hypothetical protein [Mycobacterium sp. URHD0025]|uniref:hypothetical protein n=1 Tax=Mycobacterium sp. URHD0025 TaxID=1298864 RepID=UPI0003F4B9A5|nr:hypothetical protein [Mycobacterium sp. URHD0025]